MKDVLRVQVGHVDLEVTNDFQKQRLVIFTVPVTKAALEVLKWPTKGYRTERKMYVSLMIED